MLRQGFRSARFEKASAAKLPITRNADLEQADRQMGAIRAFVAKSRAYFLCLMDENDRVIAAAPLFEGSRPLEVFIQKRSFTACSFSTREIIGSELFDFKNAGALEAICENIFEIDDDIEAVSLPELDASSDLARAIAASRRISSRFVPIYIRRNAEWQFMPTPRSYEEHLSSFSRKRRYNLKRQERLLQSHLGELCELIEVTRNDQLSILDSAMQALGQWRGRGGKDSVRYYKACAEHGLLHSFILQAGDRTLGVVLALGGKDAISVHSFHRDSDLDRYSVGSTLWQKVLERLSGRGDYSTIVFGYGKPGLAAAHNNIVTRRDDVLFVRRNLFILAKLAPFFTARLLRYMAHLILARPVERRPHARAALESVIAKP